MHKQRYTAVKMNSKDNVATAVVDLNENETASMRAAESEVEKIKLVNSVSFGHKLALVDINKGSPIIKYGETIGLANRDIKIGEHVHIHNIDSVRGKGEANEIEI